MRKDAFFLNINLSDYDKANYLSRLFAIFYENLLKFWLERKGFSLKGRPSVYSKKGKYLRKTFDYTVERNGKYYIIEAKSYLAFQNSTQIVLSLDILDGWFGYEDSLQFFCELGSKDKPYDNYTFKNDYGKFVPHGKILFWAKIKKDEVAIMRRKYHLSYIFSVEEAIKNMAKETKKKSRKGIEYSKEVLKFKKWSNVLFNALLNSA